MRHAAQAEHRGAVVDQRARGVAGHEQLGVAEAEVAVVGADVGDA